MEHVQQLPNRVRTNRIPDFLWLRYLDFMLTVKDLSSEAFVE